MRCSSTTLRVLITTLSSCVCLLWMSQIFHQIFTRLLRIIVVRLKTCAGACGLLWKSPLTDSITGLPIIKGATTVAALPELIRWIGITTPDVWRIQSSSLDSLISLQCWLAGMTLGCNCGYWGVGFAICKGATGCIGTGSTGGLKVWCLARLFCGTCGGTLSFCRTGGSTLNSLG